MRPEDFSKADTNLPSICAYAFRTRDEKAEECDTRVSMRDDELTPEQLERCRREAEQALERAAEKIFGTLEKTKDAIRSEPRIAPEDTKTAANTISARTVAKIDAAASPQEEESPCQALTKTK
jgi:hypothetical protein